MPLLDCSESIPSAVLARALMTAWMEGRFAELDETLRWCAIAAAQTPDAGEEEKLDLVAGLAERAKSSAAGTGGSPEPLCGAWMTLVLHLAERRLPGITPTVGIVRTVPVR